MMKKKFVLVGILLLATIFYFSFYSSKDYKLSIPKNEIITKEQGFYLAPVQLHSGFFTKKIIAKGIWKNEAVEIQCIINYLSNSVTILEGSNNISLTRKILKMMDWQINYPYIFHNYGENTYWFNWNQNAVVFALEDKKGGIKKLIIDIPEGRVIL